MNEQRVNSKTQFGRNGDFEKNSTFRPSTLASSFDNALMVFRRLSKQLNIPNLDQEFYYYSFMQERTEGNLFALLKLNRYLKEHKKRTCMVIACVRAREELMQEMKDFEKQIDDNQLQNTRLQTIALKLLQRFQTTGLQCCEKILFWRQSLTRPYAFVYHRQNYFLKMLSDARWIDKSKISLILPIKVGKTPLLSAYATLGSVIKNKHSVSARRYFLEKDASRRKSTSTVPSETIQLTTRLLNAESILLEEKKMQRELQKHLQQLLFNGYFITTLNTPKAVPNGFRGIEIDGTFRSDIHEALSKFRNEVIARLQEQAQINQLSSRSGVTTQHENSPTQVPNLQIPQETSTTSESRTNTQSERTDIAGKKKINQQKRELPMKSNVSKPKKPSQSNKSLTKKGNSQGDNNLSKDGSQGSKKSTISNSQGSKKSTIGNSQGNRNQDGSQSNETSSVSKDTEPSLPKKRESIRVYKMNDITIRKSDQGPTITTRTGEPVKESLDEDDSYQYVSPSNKYEGDSSQKPSLQSMTESASEAPSEDGPPTPNNARLYEPPSAPASDDDDIMVSGRSNRNFRSAKVSEISSDKGDSNEEISDSNDDYDDLEPSEDIGPKDEGLDDDFDDDFDDDKMDDDFDDDKMDEDFDDDKMDEDNFDDKIDEVNLDDDEDDFDPKSGKPSEKDSEKDMNLALSSEFLPDNFDIEDLDDDDLDIELESSAHPRQSISQSPRQDDFD